jgi:hypothetical protein
MELHGLLEKFHRRFDTLASEKLLHCELDRWFVPTVSRLQVHIWNQRHTISYQQKPLLLFQNQQKPVQGKVSYSMANPLRKQYHWQRYRKLAVWKRAKIHSKLPQNQRGLASPLSWASKPHTKCCCGCGKKRYWSNVSQSSVHSESNPSEA